MKSPLISIAIIAYNQSEKIEDTIQSVINLEFPGIFSNYTGYSSFLLISES